jgi:hypothetical protein
MALLHTFNAKEASVPTQAWSVVAGLLSRAAVQKTLWLSTLPLLLAVTAMASEPALVNVVSILGDSIDARKLKPSETSGANVNRWGFFSDLFYDYNTGYWYALSDRGPGGGLLEYATRVQRMRIPVDRHTGVVGTPVIDRSILFKGPDGRPFNGLNPALLNDDKSVLGLSFDPEGIVVGRGGHLFVADEYGPSLYEFSPYGRFLRAFKIPDNLRPKESNGTPNYLDGSPTITSGRQDNRGFEGLAINPAGTRLYGVLQDPLVNEGSDSDGRRSRNVRIVEFDSVTGESTAQYIYQLESRITLNAITADTADDFPVTSQGRNIGVSAIVAINATDFLVLERDNRGLGIEVTPTPLHKRIYRISLRGATNVQDISLANTDDLPSDVQPVSKEPFIDVLAQLTEAGQTVPEKLEGLAIGPRLANGSFAILLGTDNDYSVTQTGAGVQFDVCVDATGTRREQVSIDQGCPDDLALIPGFLMSFKGTVKAYQPARHVYEKDDDGDDDNAVD